MPKLLETFDQLIWSSEIRSSDRFPIEKELLELSLHSDSIMNNII